MSREEFEAFLNSHSSETRSGQIDWKAKLANWKKSLDGFYGQVDSFLAPYMKTGKISVRHVTKDLSEDFVGQYQAKAADILVGDILIRLEPIGMNVIGARGRIDMIGPRGIVKFVLVDRNTFEPTSKEQLSEAAECEWRIATLQPQVKFLPLTDESFYRSLMTVTNG